MKILVCVLLLTTATLAQEERKFVEDNISPLALSILRLLSSVGNPEISPIEKLIALLSLNNSPPPRTKTPQSTQRSTFDLNSAFVRPDSVRSSKGSSSLENSISHPLYNPKSLGEPNWKGLAAYKTITKPAPVSVPQPNPESFYVPISVPANRPYPSNIRQPDPATINTQVFDTAKNPVELPFLLLLGVPGPYKGESETYGIDISQGLPVVTSSQAQVKNVPVLEKEPTTVLQRVVRGILPQANLIREQEGIPHQYIGREQVGVPQPYLLKQVPAGSPLWFKQQVYQQPHLLLQFN